jgi:hypothetical protein
MFVSKTHALQTLQILAATARFDRDRATGPNLSTPETDDERRIPGPPAKEAAPYLRQLFFLINDPDLERGTARATPLSIPENLRAFVTGYMLARGWEVTYLTGSDSKESSVLLTPCEAS